MCDMPSDIYFSNLDGTWWDAEHEVWGGGRNSGANDYFAEVFVGRLTVDDAEQISNIVGKIIWYDLTADIDFLGKAAFFGGKKSSKMLVNPCLTQSLPLRLSPFHFCFSLLINYEPAQTGL